MITSSLSVIFLGGCCLLICSLFSPDLFIKKQLDLKLIVFEIVIGSSSHSPYQEMDILCFIYYNI